MWTHKFKFNTNYYLSFIYFSLYLSALFDSLCNFYINIFQFFTLDFDVSIEINQ